MKVLVAEDDPGVREGLEDLISERALVVAVSSVDEALRALDAADGDQFRLVIADMRLGGEHTGGRRVLERARKAGTRVVVMSGLSGHEVKQALDGVEPDAVLSKPFSIDDALEMVDRFLAG